MSDGVVVRLRKVMRNPLLKRRQFVVQVHHPDKAPVSKKTLKKMIADVSLPLRLCCATLER